MKYIYLSIVLKYTFWVSVLQLSLIFSYDFNFTTFERQISYFSLHYISIKVLEVESRYYWRFSTAWYGTVRHGSVRYGTAQFGSVCISTAV